MPSASFSGAAALFICGSRLLWDAWQAYEEPAHTERLIWSAYTFAEVLQAQREAVEQVCPLPPPVEEFTCPALPEAEQQTPAHLVTALLVVIGCLSVLLCCACALLRRRRSAGVIEIQPYQPSPIRDYGSPARRARVAAIEDW